MSDVLALDETYQKLTNHIISVFDNNAQSVNQNVSRRWANFKPDGSTEQMPLYSKDYLTKIFDRDRLNKDYAELFTKAEAAPGDLGKAVIISAQVNVVAGFERDLSSRFKSRVRSLAHRASEIDADGTDFSPLRTSLVRSMRDILASNGTPTNVPPPSDIAFNPPPVPSDDALA